MEMYQAVILGIVQGLTEFLPISSSGHLVLVQQLFGLKEAELVFDVGLHVATLTAVLIYFRRDLAAILTALGRMTGKVLTGRMVWSQALLDGDVRMAVLIVIGTLPTVVIGLCFHRIAERMFSSVALVGAALCITGMMIWLTRPLQNRSLAIDRFSIKKALIIGLVQGLAITPGISRSGSTIAVGLYLGLSRELSARFSFLLSIPAICGAAVLHLKDLNGAEQLPPVVLASGMAAAGVSGYLALAFLVFIVKKGRLFVFAPYCWLLGLLCLGLTIFS
ncbi:undecaprenyl-diphosphate phosphatase [Desulfatiferula olefinivorans]